MSPSDLDSDSFGHNARPTGKRFRTQAGRRFSVATGKQELLCRFRVLTDGYFSTVESSLCRLDAPFRSRASSIISSRED